MKPVEKFYTPHRMTSIDAARLYQDQSLDLVFIDADHSFDAVCKDIEIWLPKVKPGGILAGDDFGSPDVTRAVNHMLSLSKIRLSKFTSWPSWIFQK
jgi:predicted O-methyltransferase YrrM